jgi:hypothetical protein
MPSSYERQGLTFANNIVRSLPRSKRRFSAPYNTFPYFKNSPTWSRFGSPSSLCRLFHYWPVPTATVFAVQNAHTSYDRSVRCRSTARLTTAGLTLVSLGVI